MTAFSRVEVPRWHEEVPGSRWFRSDLHIHTLDDAKGNVTWTSPPGLESPNDPSVAKTRAAYAKAFLHAAVLAGIEVLGLTPHCPHIPGDASISVVWEILECWQSQKDEDGVAFREKIYAIFPGFEPSVADGKKGIHLIFLFDPEIGKDRFLKIFTVITGGQDVWRNGQHNTCTNDAEAVFKALADLKQREGAGWDYLCFAPHAFSENGLIESLKGGIAKYFPHQSVAALEMKDNDLPSETLERHPNFLEEHLDTYSQSLIHNSDAYCLSTSKTADAIPTVDSPKKRGVGYRFTFLKLASPRIESIRQAFLSREARVRVAYEKNVDKKLAASQLSPTVLEIARPWLRSVEIAEGTAFFGGKGRKQRLEFSPDLTCIIGGRMTGKSTLLDGLRIHCQLSTPTEPALAQDVQERGKVFLSGNPRISIDICGPQAATLDYRQRWPAKFFTQRELQRIAKDPDNVRRILFHLSPTGADSLFRRERTLSEFDSKLQAVAAEVAKARAIVGAKEQAMKTASDAKEALDKFRDAGADRLLQQQGGLGTISHFRELLTGIDAEFRNLNLRAARTLKSEVAKLPADQTPENLDNPEALVDLFLQQSGAGLATLKKIEARLLEKYLGAERTCRETRETVQGFLVAAGRKAEDLNQFDALSKVAAEYENARQQFLDAKAEIESNERLFQEVQAERTSVADSLRLDLQAIMDTVNNSIGSIHVSLRPAADRSPLDNWIKLLRDAGVTRWWNDNKSLSDPHQLHQKFERNKLSDLGMSPTVTARFTELMTADRVFTLRSLRSADECKIEAQVGPAGTFRSIDKLSGGKQISVVLSLLLESSDTSPLVVDQPEDELDKAFLADTLLPILRRLKGRRQIIFATHDANIVVNGDADQVIFLDATADQAEVKSQGAIDDPDIRGAILKILDGGQEAFDMRKRKYGY